jgi:putative nucleotidyltransferase with HDIG domain
VVRVIESDPILVVSILKAVNSSASGLANRCTSVRAAVPLLGVRGALQIASAAATLSAVEGTSKWSEKILEHCHVVAALSSYLAPSCGLKQEDAYTAALLHDIGKLMLLQSHVVEIEAILNGNPDSIDVAHKLEREAFGYDHAVLGAHVLLAWKIPEPVPKIVAWHHARNRAYRAGGKVAGLTALLRLADYLSVALGQYAAPTPETFEPLRGEPIEDYLGWHVDQIGASWKVLQRIREAALADRPMSSPPPALDLHASAPTAAAPTEATPSETSGLSFPQGTNGGGTNGEGTTAEGDPNGASEAASETKEDLCAICEKAPKTGACSRCKRAVCSKHAPAAGAVCSKCERDFQRLQQQSQGKFWVAGIAVGGGLAVALSMAVPVGAAAAVGLVLAFVTSTTMQRGLRQRFLQSAK